MRNATLTAVSVGTSATLLAGPSKHRRVLCFSPNLATGYTVAPSDAVAASKGLAVTASGGLVTLRFEEIGTLVCQAWYGIAASGIDAAVLEGFEV